MNDFASLANIRIVLSHPAHPGNIGAAARAMKTMGLTRLYLVRPERFPDVAARVMASRGLELLEHAVICETLDLALAGTSLAIALSARERDLSHPPAEVRAAAVEAVRHAEHDEVALVFGNETSGLTNEEVMKCNRLASIPADAGFGSLNLAAAVQVACYELRQAARIAPAAPERGEPAGFEEVENLYQHLESSLYASGFLHPDYPRRLMDRLRRLFSRAGLEREEVNILRGMLSSWDAGVADNVGKNTGKNADISSAKK